MICEHKSTSCVRYTCVCRYTYIGIYIRRERAKQESQQCKGDKPLLRVCYIYIHIHKCMGWVEVVRNLG